VGPAEKSSAGKKRKALLKPRMTAVYWPKRNWVKGGTRQWGALWFGGNRQTGATSKRKSGNLIIGEMKVKGFPGAENKAKKDCFLQKKR